VSELTAEVWNPETQEVRYTSESGGAKGAKPARFDMIPMDSLWELAEQFGKGADKYPAVNGLDNWRNGYPWHLSFGAAFRHLSAALGGEDIDPETGSKHVIAAAWHMFVIAHWMNHPTIPARFDDRQDATEKLRAA
jgi:Domain of unknown function (DUF5664)